MKYYNTVLNKMRLQVNKWKLRVALNTLNRMMKPFSIFPGGNQIFDMVKPTHIADQEAKIGKLFDRCQELERNLNES